MDSARVHCARSVCINYTENKEVTYTNFRTTVEPADSVLLRFHRQTIDQLTDDLRRKKGCKGATILFTKQKVKSDFIRATIKVEIKGYNNQSPNNEPMIKLEENNNNDDLYNNDAMDLDKNEPQGQPNGPNMISWMNLTFPLPVSTLADRDKKALTTEVGTLIKNLRTRRGKGGP